MQVGEGDECCDDGELGEGVSEADSATDGLAYGCVACCGEAVAEDDSS